MSFVSETFKNLDEALGMVEEFVRDGKKDYALQGIKQIRQRFPSLQAGIEAERDRMLEKH